MHWVSIFIIAIASNLDNLGIGVSFGIRSTKIPFLSNLVVAFISMIAAYLSISAGSFILRYVPAGVAGWIGGSMIMAIGVYTMTMQFKQEHKHKNVQPSAPAKEGTWMKIIEQPVYADKDNNHVISWQESIFLGLALAINCIASGFGAGISGISAFWTTAAIGVFSLLTVDIGLRAGYRISGTWLGKHSGFIAGGMLIMIGIYEIVA